MNSMFIGLAHAAGDRLYAAWGALATTRMRRGDLLGLRWVDIDFDVLACRS